MADFPASLMVRIGSKEKWLDPRTVVYNRNGVPHIRMGATAKRRAFTLNMKDMSDADRAVFEPFYDANRDQVFNLTYKSVVYHVAFTDSEIDFNATEPTYQDSTLNMVVMD